MGALGRRGLPVGCSHQVERLWCRSTDSRCRVCRCPSSRLWSPERRSWHIHTSSGYLTTFTWVLFSARWNVAVKSSSAALFIILLWSTLGCMCMEGAIQTTRFILIVSLLLPRISFYIYNFFFLTNLRRRTYLRRSACPPDRSWLCVPLPLCCRSDSTSRSGWKPPYCGNVWMGQGRCWKRSSSLLSIPRPQSDLTCGIRARPRTGVQPAAGSLTDRCCGSERRSGGGAGRSWCRRWRRCWTDSAPPGRTAARTWVCPPGSWSAPPPAHWGPGPGPLGGHRARKKRIRTQIWHGYIPLILKSI